MSENKVQFGLKNVHYAVMKSDGTYDKPVKIDGAVSLEVSPVGETYRKYADDGVIYSASVNGGYEGTLVLTTIPESFAIDCLGETKDANGVLIETTEAKGSNFALLFEFDGDQRQTRNVLYSCTASRPNIAGETKTETITTHDAELQFTAVGRISDGAVKARSTKETDPTAYEKWYTEVYEPNPVTP